MFCEKQKKQSEICFPVDFGKNSVIIDVNYKELMRRTGHDLLRIPAFRELPAGARGQHTAKSHHLRAVRVKWTQSSPDRLSTNRRKPVCPAKHPKDAGLRRMTGMRDRETGKRSGNAEYISSSDRENLSEDVFLLRLSVI